MRLLRSLRQLRFPRAIRINPPAWPPGSWKALLGLADAAAATSLPPSHIDPSSGPLAILATEQSDLIAQLATGLWRLRQKMVQPGTDKPLEEMRKAFRHLQSTWDLRVGAGVEIQGHTDAPFDAGLALKVLTYQPMPGFVREKVIDTIKPTVYYRNQAVQIGEVIVGTPEHPRSQPTNQGDNQ